MAHWKGFMHVPAVEQQKMITGQAADTSHRGSIALMFRLDPLLFGIMVIEDIVAAGSEDQSA